METDDYIYQSLRLYAATQKMKNEIKMWVDENLFDLNRLKNNKKNNKNGK